MIKQIIEVINLIFHFWKKVIKGKGMVPSRLALGPSPVHLKTREFAPGSVFVVVVPDLDVIHPDSRLLLQKHLFKLLLSSGKARFRGPDMEIFCLQILPYKVFLLFWCPSLL